MTTKLLAGPILGLESDSLYTVCFLSAKAVNAAVVRFNNDSIQAQPVAETVKGIFWRAEVDIPGESTELLVSYKIELDSESAQDANERNQWTFYVPAIDEKPVFAYTSCNGFSSAEILTKTEQPYALWEDMQRKHYQHPFSLLIMGGDQLYADEIWSAVPELQRWSHLNKTDKITRTFNSSMRDQVERFYEKLYCERWNNSAMSLMLSSIPSVMMWDDHDIFDGWGSYPSSMQECDVYQGIYAIAKRYFELFQIRTRANQSLLDNTANHYAFGFTFRHYHLLALDNRAERTREQVMSDSQWHVINQYLEQCSTAGDLLVMSAVPVVYRDFSFTESAFDQTPWEEELTDDLKDHWRAKEHQGERARLIMRLLNNAQKRTANQHCRTVILSGDVHLACLGVINDSRQAANPLKIHQIVSSGVVHTSPSRIAWLGIMAATNDDDEYLNEDRTIKISMLQPFGSDKYIRARNYVTLEEGTDNKLWVNWECESQTNKPSYPLV